MNAIFFILFHRQDQAYNGDERHQCAEDARDMEEGDSDDVSSPQIGEVNSDCHCVP